MLILPLEAAKIHHEPKSSSSNDAMEKNKDLKLASKSVKSRNSDTENEVPNQKKDDEQLKKEDKNRFKPNNDLVIEKIMGEVQVPVLILPLEASKIHHELKSTSSKDAMEKNKDLKHASKSVKSRNSATENEVLSKKRDDERRKRKKEDDPVIEKIMGEVQVPVLILPLEAARIHHRSKSSTSKDAIERNKDLKLASKSVKSRNSDTENEVANQKRDDERLKRTKEDDSVIEKIIEEVKLPVLILPLEASPIHHVPKSSSSKDAMEKNKDLKLASKSGKSRNSDTENEVPSEKRDDERRKRKKEDDPVIEKIMGEVQVPVLILPLEASKIHHEPKSSSSEDAMEKNKDLKLVSKSVKSRNSDTENEVPNQKRDDEQLKRTKEDKNHPSSLAKENKIIKMIFRKDLSKSTVEVPFYSAILR